MKKNGIHLISFLLLILSLSVVFYPVFSQEEVKNNNNESGKETETTQKNNSKEELKPYEKLIEKCTDECMEKNDKNECREIRIATYEKVDKFLFCNESATYQGKEYDEFGREIQNRSVSEKRCPPVTQRKTLRKLYRQLYILTEKCPSTMDGKKISDIVPKIDDKL